MRLVWDENKRASNITKHGLDFTDASKILDGFIVYEFDDTHGEERWKITGQLADEVVVLVTADIEDGETIRVISMRLATNQERLNFVMDFLGRKYR